MQDRLFEDNVSDKLMQQRDGLTLHFPKMQDRHRSVQVWKLSAR
jgi:hypothetical protein